MSDEPENHGVPAPEPGSVDDAATGQPYGAGPSVESQHVHPQTDLGDLSPSHGGGPLGMFKKQYGKSPLHLVGHLIVIAITAWVLSIMFRMEYAPRPWNLALWLLGGAVLHDGVFLPIWGVINALFARLVGASDNRPLAELAMGTPADTDQGSAPAAADGASVPGTAAAHGSRFGTQHDGGLAAGRVLPGSRDQARRVPIVNHVRVPIVISAVLFIVFVPRILNRQPQNFMNALGHAPPDFFMRWVWVTIGVIVASAALYALRWVRAGETPRAAAADARDPTVA